MINTQARQSFVQSEKGKELQAHLEAMAESPLYNTHVYSMISDPDGKLFVDKHMSYMSSFPKLDHLQYVSNLKLKTKIPAGKKAYS